jgi:isoquinoline 1-oxidoreductase alpha subunit
LSSEHSKTGPSGKPATIAEGPAPRGRLLERGALVQLTVNGLQRDVDVAPDTPLLWYLRDALQLTGTRFGCGAGLCGCCTVHVNGRAVRSCQTMVGDLDGASVTTVEHLSANGRRHPLQQAWIDLQVPQCGYCQSGQLMQAAALLAQNPTPSDAEIISAMSGNICRCGTYSRIRAAIKRAAQAMASPRWSGARP